MSLRDARCNCFRQGAASCLVTTIAGTSNDRSPGFSRRYLGARCQSNLPLLALADACLQLQSLLAKDISVKGCAPRLCLLFSLLTAGTVDPITVWAKQRLLPARQSIHNGLGEAAPTAGLASDYTLGLRQHFCSRCLISKQRTVMYSLA